MTIQMKNPFNCHSFRSTWFHLNLFPYAKRHDHIGIAIHNDNPNCHHTFLKTLDIHLYIITVKQELNNLAFTLNLFRGAQMGVGKVELHDMVPRLLGSILGPHLRILEN